MTTNQVLAGHAVADYENGEISEERALELLKEYKESDEKEGYPTDAIQRYIDEIKYSLKII